MIDPNKQIVISKPRKSDFKKITELHFWTIHNELKKLTPSICQFFDLSLSKEDIEENIREMLDDPDHEVVVAIVDEKFAGYISLWTENYPDDLIPAPYTTIEYIEVLPEYQNMGVGQKLLEEAEKIAKEKKHSYLELLVWETNQKAINLYKKNEFSSIVQRMAKKIL